MVQVHCSRLKMKLGLPKCKVMSNIFDSWELFDGDEVAGCLDKVLSFKYLGMETNLSPFKAALAMRERAVAIAKKYKAACMRVARDGPDMVDVAMCTWQNIAIPSITYGCESVPFNDTALKELDRLQMTVGKEVLGLAVSAPHAAVEVLLGVRPVREVIFTRQLKFFNRLKNQDDARWSKDAFMDHLLGGWSSPYLKMIYDIKEEVEMIRGPMSGKHVDLVLQHHFVTILNEKISNLDLPALHYVEKRGRAVFVNESKTSQVMGSRVLSGISGLFVGFLVFVNLSSLVCICDGICFVSTFLAWFVFVIKYGLYAVQYGFPFLE